MTSNDQMLDVLTKTKTIAVVGLSSNPRRPSFGVSQYLQRKGYRIIPVNPNEQTVLGEKSYRSLADVPENIDLVDVFRRPEYVPEIVEEVIRLNIPALWLQEGVVHQAAAKKARDAGIVVVMDKCILKEHRAHGL
ncbi:MAG: CoA-binding protein [Acidobacteria bacterium]|nr:MAG: CoA-binding protein [Acidobacteriota bacterium]PYY22471.1 MAG: CoA-binding protein [Acidobacteriota bacterium]